MFFAFGGCLSHSNCERKLAHGDGVPKEEKLTLLALNSKFATLA